MDFGFRWSNRGVTRPVAFAQIFAADCVAHNDVACQLLAGLQQNPSLGEPVDVIGDDRGVAGRDRLEQISGNYGSNRPFIAQYRLVDRPA